MILEYIYIRREGDLETLKEKVKIFEAFAIEELIDAYNKQAKCGITGVHAQALYLMSMGHAFLMRFGTSPIYMENNVLGMKGQIKLSGKTYQFVDNTAY
jgi:hypothetical protein